MVIINSMALDNGKIILVVTTNGIIGGENDIQKLEAQISLYRSPDITKSSWECLHAEYI